MWFRAWLPSFGSQCHRLGFFPFYVVVLSTCHDIFSSFYHSFLLISLLNHVRLVHHSPLLFPPHSWWMVHPCVSLFLCSSCLPHLLSFKLVDFLILWTCLHFVFLYLDCGISLHGSSLFISIRLLPFVCLCRLFFVTVTLRISSSSPASVGSRLV